MNHKKLEMIAAKNLSSRLADVDEEFRDYLTGLSFRKEMAHEKLSTFSPLEAVEDFEMRGLFAIAEPTRDEMLANEQGFSKLLANMLNQCRPGALSQDDVEQLSGINGRELSGL